VAFAFNLAATRLENFTSGLKHSRTKVDEDGSSWRTLSRHLDRRGWLVLVWARTAHRAIWSQRTWFVASKGLRLYQQTLLCTYRSRLCSSTQPKRPLRPQIFWWRVLPYFARMTCYASHPTDREPSIGGQSRATWINRLSCGVDIDHTRQKAMSPQTMVSYERFLNDTELSFISCVVRKSR